MSGDSETVNCGGSVKASLSCGRRSSQGCSARWKTDSGKGEEGVPVRGVIKWARCTTLRDEV